MHLIINKMQSHFKKLCSSRPVSRFVEERYSKTGNDDSLRTRMENVKFLHM